MGRISNKFHVCIDKETTITFISKIISILKRICILTGNAANLRLSKEFMDLPMALVHILNVMLFIL